MSKRIPLIIILLINISIAEELTFPERIQASFIIGIGDGLSGIADSTIETISNPEKIVNNVKQLKKEQKESQLNFYKKQYEARGKHILKMNEDRNKLIQKYNKLRSENIKLRATIKNYNMNKADNFDKKKSEENRRLKALEQMKQDLKSK